MEDLERRLLDARQRSVRLFAEVTHRKLIAAGRTEREVSADISRLALEEFGARRFWHKRIVRAGPNALLPYRENPPVRTIEPSDVVYVDFGPVFDGDVESDFGRTYVLEPNDKTKKLLLDQKSIWTTTREHYLRRPEMTGAELYAFQRELAQTHGWSLAGWHAGHLIGTFPHERAIGDGREYYICAENNRPMTEELPNGERPLWVLETHLNNFEWNVGGFCEDLLNVPISGEIF